MSEFVGFTVQVELKDGKLIQGKISKATAKGLTLHDVKFGDGGTSQAFKVRSSRLKDLKVLAVASRKGSGTRPQSQPQPRNKMEWQDDDVSQIKDDFDFQSSLRMFNKKDVFEQIRQQDAVNPEDRLVSHNKKQQSKGDTKFENDELVIPDAKNDAWKQLSSEEDLVEDDEDEDDDDYEVDDIDDPNYLPITKSINITHLLHSAQENETLSEHNDQEILSKLEQMILQQTRQPASAAKQYILRAKDVKMTVPMATPVQLLEIERVALEAFGVTSQMMLENFAINASFYIKQRLGGNARMRSQKINPEPLVVILTSDSNRCGTRALALGRHLCQQNQVRVVTYFTCPASDIQDNQVKEQLELYKKCGGKVVNSVNVLESTVAKLNSPVEIIIDAMQGFDCSLSDLYETASARPRSYDSSDNGGSGGRSEETIEKRIMNVISWCNKFKSQAQIWSLDISSGYDSGSGLQNSEKSIHSTGIISTGWPLTSLQSVKTNMPHLDTVVMIDLGIPQGVYLQRTSLRKFNITDLFVTEGHLALEI